MDCAKKLAHLLEGCGAKYTRIDAKEGTLFTVSTGDEQYFVLVRDDGAGIEMWSRYFTPEQAVVAMVGRGNLTAEQVREAIMSADRWRKPMGDTGMTNTHLIIRDDGWQAIADELNATVGAGTIEKAAERIEVLSGFAREYLHRYGMLMSMAGEDVTDEVLAMESVINEVCGRKAVDE